MQCHACTYFGFLQAATYTAKLRRINFVCMVVSYNGILSEIQVLVDKLLAIQQAYI